MGVLILATILFGFYLYKQTRVKSGWEQIRVGETMVKVMVRDTMEGRRQGLSGFEKLEDNEGMLFVFPLSAKHSFWMKEMKFNLDFVWIKDDKVVEITEGVLASGGKKTMVKPSVLVNKVLEVNSGFIKKNKIKVGDEVDL